jgi:hypothetical protein
MLLAEDRRYYSHSRAQHLYMKQICLIQSIPNPAKTKTPGTPTMVNISTDEDFSEARERKARPGHREPN